MRKSDNKTRRNNRKMGKSKPDIEREGNNIESNSTIKSNIPSNGKWNAKRNRKKDEKNVQGLG